MARGEMLSTPVAPATAEFVAAPDDQSVLITFVKSRTDLVRFPQKRIPNPN
jgi:hypothetical protein